MRVIALDPGYDRLGVAVMENTSGTEVLLYSCCVESSRADTLPDRLLTIGTTFALLLDEYKPDAMGIETLFFNKNVKTAIGVAQARGTLLYLAKQAGCTVYEFSPQQIKVAVTGHGNSDKKSVIDMVMRLVKNAPLKGLDDEYDAIAVGVTTLATYGRLR